MSEEIILLNLNGGDKENQLKGRGGERAEEGV